MTIWVFPKDGAYNGELYDAVARVGIQVNETDLGFGWLLQKAKKDDILHVHWPSYRYLRTGNIISIWYSFLKFTVFMFGLKAKGVQLWWTAHNLMPHERCRVKIIDLWARYIVIFVSKRIFVHGKTAACILTNKFNVNTDQLVNIPHGHWIDYYGEIQKQTNAREKLSIPINSTVYLMFGQLKPYKNLEGLIEVFKEFSVEDNYLLIAGKFSDSGYQQKIEHLINTIPNIKLDAKFIPDSDVACYLAASDVMCMPYNEILTSGTAMLAMSYGRPVISLNKGYLTDVVTSESGILIDSININTLKNAMTEVKLKQWDENAILRHVSQFTFDDAAKVFAKECRSSKTFDAVH